MAGDWIKVEKATARKPEVVGIATRLGIHRRHAFGLCVEFWSWCDDQLKTGHVPSVTTEAIDEFFGHAGFANALLSVGWLLARSGSLEVPHFDRHMSESAKNRALSTVRKQNQRAADESRNCHDGSVTRVDESRGDKSRKDQKKGDKKKGEPPFDPLSIPIPECANNPAFLAVWHKWVAYRTKRKPKLLPVSWSEQLEMLASLDISEARDATQKSITNGWQGVFPRDHTPKRSGRLQANLLAAEEFINGGDNGSD